MNAATDVRLRIGLALLAALCLAPGGDGSDARTRGGVAVERVARHAEAARAGLREKDVILSWSQGRAAGGVASPADLWALEIERAPLGAVTLEGARDGERHTWQLAQPQWGLDT